MITIEELQHIANVMYKHFGLEKIPVIFNNRFKSYRGTYYWNNRIELASNLYDKEVKNTLLHELSHHLVRDRFNKRVPGYFRMEMWPKMVPDSCTLIDRKVWYKASDDPKEKEPIYFRKQSHGKHFVKCVGEMKEAYNKLCTLSESKCV